MFILFAILSGPTPPPPQPQEAEVQRLVREARDGNSAAARRLYETHAHVVFRCVRPMCGSEAEAEDVVQDTFVRALGALDRYEQRAGSRFVSWLLTIGMNTARKRRRYQARMRPSDLSRMQEDSFDVTSADPAGDALDTLRLRALMIELLAALPERDREVLTLRYGGELSASEVATMMRLSEANVRKICERQRHRLLDEIRDRTRVKGGDATGLEAEL